jgi:hypothetical protein
MNNPPQKGFDSARNGPHSGLALSKVRSTASKPAAKQAALPQARMNECVAFMNKAG